jgi:hypothetical protein
MQTNDLITKLTSELKPVSVLKPISRRFSAWIIAACVITGVMMALMGVRKDLGAKFTDAWFVAQTLAILSLIIIGSWSALRISVPGDGERFSHHQLPLILLAAWIFFEIVHIAKGVFALGASALGPDLHFACGYLILGAGIIISGPLFWLIRKATPLEPLWCGALAGLSGAAFASLAFQVICPYDHSTHSFLWHLLPTVMAGVIGIFFGKKYLSPSRRSIL